VIVPPVPAPATITSMFLDRRLDDSIDACWRQRLGCCAVCTYENLGKGAKVVCQRILLVGVLVKDDGSLDVLCESLGDTNVAFRTVVSVASAIRTSSVRV
jgi:hypothetical protein